jgi:hypothetical protein
MKFWQRTNKKRRMDMKDEDVPNTPEQNVPPSEYSSEPPLSEAPPIGTNEARPAAVASPLERLPESVSAAESHNRGNGGGY